MLPPPAASSAATSPSPRAAAEAFLGELDPALVAAVAASVAVPGRLERIADEPPTYVDAAHNPDGAAALAEALPALAGGRRVVACLAILADKDAAAMVAALAPALERAVCTELPAAALAGHGRPGARSRPGGGAGGALRGGRARGRGGAGASRRRCAAPPRWPREPPEGALLVAGSHYAHRPAGRAAAVLTVRGFAHGSRAPAPNCSR